MNRPRSLAAFQEASGLPRPDRERRSYRRSIVAGAVLSLSSSLAVADPCPLGPFERELIVEVLENALLDALFVANLSDEFPVRKRAFALSLIGSDDGSRGVLEAECPEAQDFEPVCSFPPFEEPVPEFWETRDRCVQQSCSSDENSDSINVYLTVKGRTGPHIFRYTADEFVSEVVYDPNPFVRWDYTTDFSADPFRGMAFVNAFHQVTVFREGQAPIPLDHVITMTVLGVGDSEDFFARVEVEFPLLGRRGIPVRAVVTLDDLSVTQGSITLGKKRLATIEGEFAGKNFGFTDLVWERGCGKNRSFLRGDVTGGGKRNSRDLNLLAAHLFQRAALPCEDSADVDDNGMVDAADLVYLTSWLLHDGEPPLPPSDLRGPDPTDDGLNCAW